MNVGMCECGIMGMWEYGNRVMLLNVECCMLYVVCMDGYLYLCSFYCYRVPYLVVH